MRQADPRLLTWILSIALAGAGCGKLAGSSPGAGASEASGVCACGQAAGCGYAPAVVTTGLVLHLDAPRNTGSTNAGSGCSQTSWTDLSSTGNSGTLTSFSSCGSSSGWNGTGVPSDPFRLDFDGTDDHVQLGAAPTLGTGSFTAQAWIKTSVTGTDKTIASWGKWDTTNQGVYFRVHTSNLLNTDLSGTGGPSSAATVADGTWHHVTIVNSAGTFQHYLEGASSGGSSSLSPDFTVNTGRIGRGINGDGLFSGSIGWVAVYNLVLTASEIQQNYDALKQYYLTSACP